MASLHQTPYGTWEVHYRDESRRQRTKSFRRKAEARQYAAAIEAEKARSRSLPSAFPGLSYIRTYAQIAPEPAESLAQLAETFKLLAEETRLRILRSLSGGEQSVNELSASVGHPPSGVSQHLARLRTGGLVRATRMGTRMVYQFEPEGLGGPVEALLGLAVPDAPGAPDSAGT